LLHLLQMVGLFYGPSYIKGVSMIKTIQDSMEGGEFKPRHTIEIYCPNCGYDVSEAELAAKMCSDCGHSLEEPEQHVAIVVANLSSGGATF